MKDTILNLIESAQNSYELADRICELVEEKWNKAMEILYCEHCGKLMSQDLVNKLKLHPTPDGGKRGEV